MGRPVLRATGLALVVMLVAAAPALAAPHRPRIACVEVRDPGVGTYRICPPAPRRR